MSKRRPGRATEVWEKDFLYFLPARGTPGREQSQECLIDLRAALRQRGTRAGDVVKLTFFVRASGPADYLRRKQAITEGLRAALPKSRPALSIVPQPPERGRETALEAVVLRRPSRSLEIVSKNFRGVPYILLRAQGGREVIAAGISGGRSGDVGVRASSAFARAAGILGREGLGFSDVARQWNFIEDILSRCGKGRRVRQNYQIFNDIRAFAYDRAGLRAGFPAATGIGMDTGGFILEVIAAGGTAAEKTVPVSNPLQADAYRYSPDVLVGTPLALRAGKQTPRFERAKVVLRRDSGTCYVSGTAAIVGQDVVCRGDVAGQTRATVRTIERLVEPANLRLSGAPVSALAPRFSYVRTYVKREGDIPEVARIVRASFGSAPALFVAADICRADLLVEIEGAVEVLTK
jgi:enamine deaminase RidA (YjgF/YER057c/UK114 family)